MKKDHYLVLQLKPEATAEEIRSAYRRRALEVHPDQSGAGSAPFLELQEAYAVLRDPARRAVYDRATDDVPVRHANPAGRAEPLRVRRADAEPLRAAPSPSRSNATTFPGRLWSDGWFPRSPGTARTHQPILQVPLSPEQACRGGKVRIQIPICVTCRTCGGRGNAGPYECRSCEGEGALAGAYPVIVSYPAGLQGDYLVPLRLGHFGLQDLTVCFRPSGATWPEAGAVWW
ncbi:MAG TPA: DnaJ domain-containing protein [Chthoniobacterales bacterium]